MYYLGLDVGSTSVNTVILDEKLNVLLERYDRTHGRPVEKTEAVLKEVFEKYPQEEIIGGAVTGNAGKLIGELLGLKVYNEVVAQSKATGHYYPDVKTIVEVGGEDAKLIMMDKGKDGNPRVRDFSMNTVCAAGTGSFLDQQANRLGVHIEKEFEELALKSEKPPRIAGRCSVFAKSDMIHLQQVATPDYDILAGLCFAMARNFKSNIGQGKEFARPIAFQGGVAANKAMVWAFEDILGLEKGELIIPKHFASMGAIGSVLVMLEENIAEDHKPKEISNLSKYINNRPTDNKGHQKLPDNPYETVMKPVEFKHTDKIDAYLGVDVGSISTNVVVIDNDGNVLARRYLMTAGRPIEAVRRGLEEIGNEVNDKVTIKGACTTGSGRYLISDFIGADLAKNEITAHATGAAFFDKEVDTIFEIGGQDSKYISLENGAVVDFTMNKVCAAGTGSFLEEQAEKLGINIKEEFGKLALESDSPAPLGERCTVFMESDLNLNQQQGVPVEDLVGGLSYSIVTNYLNRVVEERKVGNNIFFQGGPAANRGIKAAFEEVTGKKITVPPHHDVMGAIGCAILARNECSGESNFKGFDLSKRSYTIKSFECVKCSNNCEIRKVTIENEKPLHYGSRCGMFDDEKVEKKGHELPRLFAEREEMLENSYKKNEPDDWNGKTIGMPRASLYFELYPFWKALLTELGYKIVVSDPTNKKLINKGLEYITAESCYPIKVAHGHIKNLLDKNIDHLFNPCIVKMPKSFDNMRNNYACPYVQSLPYITEAAMDLNSQVDVMVPIINFQNGDNRVLKDLTSFFKKYGFTKKAVKNAVNRAFLALESFETARLKRGKEILDSLPEDANALVIISRPYNGCDPGLNLQIPDKLRDLGVIAIPQDFLPLNDIDVSKDWKTMYWRYGQKILQAGSIIAKDPRLNAIYITNFGCGPDSFISKFFTKIMDGKPYLTLELDEHSADAGMITRCEAFLDSLKNVKDKQTDKTFVVDLKQDSVSLSNRKIYIPYMDDHAHAIAASLKCCGYEAEALPMPDDESVILGRKHTSGKECYPCITTTGDILKKIYSKEFDRDKTAFFMPTASGPCRFGMYNKFHRIILDELGYEDIPLYLLDQGSEFQKNAEGLGTKFQRLCWNAILAIDIIGRAVRQVRPYEVSKSESDKIYDTCLNRVTTSVENGGDDLVEVLHVCRKDFENINVDKTKLVPRIGIIGEIYVRSVEYANEFVVRNLEKLGAECNLPPLEEWIKYIDWERNAEFWINGEWTKLTTEKIANQVQEMDANRIYKPFKGFFNDWHRETSSKEVIKLGKPYLDDAVRGETILSMGRAAEYYHHGYHGVVNLIPFNCMPGTVASALVKKFQQDHNNIPMLTLSFDGTKLTGLQTKLEAFVYQAKQYALEQAEVGAV